MFDEDGNIVDEPADGRPYEDKNLLVTSRPGPWDGQVPQSHDEYWQHADCVGHGTYALIQVDRLLSWDGRSVSADPR